MNTTIPATYLVMYAKAQVGNPYWFGCYGQISNVSVWTAFKRTYPQYYTEERKQRAKSRGDYGKKVHDCRGLLLGALWTYPRGTNMSPVYVPSQDMDANTIYAKAKEKGPISTIPKIAGIAVWKNNHIGIVEKIDENGDIIIIEALGFDYGVVRSKLKNRSFTNWCKPHFVEYDTIGNSEPVEEPKPTGGNKVQVTLSVLRNGSKGNEVKTLQILLNEKCKNGPYLSTDGDFGPMTEKQVRNYQQLWNLECDGVVGKNTWTSLLTH